MKPLKLTGSRCRKRSATTVNATLKVGKATESVEVTANPLLNATDTTNGYTLDSAQIELTPLATGSFTQLAVLSPGVNAELLANLDSNAGLGNQTIWANGQRDTSNTFQVNGVDATNIFNGKSSSGSTSQRYNFGVGETDSLSAANTATGTSVYGSNGNSLPSPPPEFLQELRVNTSMYDAQQGATSGAQIDVNTATGTNNWHGQVYGTFANNSLNAAPFFFKQEYQLASRASALSRVPGQSLSASLDHRRNRWRTAASRTSSSSSGLSARLQLRPGYRSVADDRASGLTDDRSTAGLETALTSWKSGTPSPVTINPIAVALMNAKLPNGQYMIPSAQTARSPMHTASPTSR